MTIFPPIRRDGEGGKAHRTNGNLDSLLLINHAQDNGQARTSRIDVINGMQLICRNDFFEQARLGVVSGFIDLARGLP